MRPPPRPRTLALVGVTGAWVALACVYVSTLWVVYSVHTRPPIGPGVRYDNIWLSSGRFAWSRYDPTASSQPVPFRPPPRWYTSVRRSVDDSWFWWVYDAKQPGGWYVGVPLWMPLALLAPLGPLPCVWSTIRHLRRRGASNACPACGYTLTGLTTDRCPECGRPVAGEQSPA